MKVEIKHRFSGKVIFAIETKSLKLAVELAVGQNADLRNANLWNADLWNADLRNAKYLHKFSIVPETGQFTAWKKASGKLVKILIPSKAKRLNKPGSRKCRAEFVKTINIYNSDGSKCKDTKTKGTHDNKLIYEIGKPTYPNKFNDDIRLECSNGIHFFITRQEAIDW